MGHAECHADGLLDLAAGELRTAQARDLPSGFLQRLDAAAGDQGRIAFLTHTASSLRTSQREGIAPFADVPISWATPPIVREVLRHASAHLLEAH
ncbi:hypothetical protein SALBM311S_06807 [Streptomyces alboniger]